MPVWLQTVLAVFAAAIGVATFLRAILESQRKEMRSEIHELRGDLKEVRTAVHGLEVRFASFEARFGSRSEPPEAPAAATGSCASLPGGVGRPRRPRWRARRPAGP